MTQAHTIVVFGGAGRTGSEVVKMALAIGHTVTAFVHAPPKRGILPEHPNLRIVVGDARNPQDVTAVLSSHDTVINIIAPKLGDKKNYDISLVATRTIVNAMQEVGISRYIGQAGAWATEYLEDASIPMQLAFKFFWPLRQIYDFKKQEDKVVRASDLNWTLVRCGLLKNGLQKPIKIAPTRHQCGLFEIPKITRKSVAAFHLSIIDDQTYSRRAPIIFN